MICMGICELATRAMTLLPSFMTTENVYEKVKDS